MAATRAQLQALFDSILSYEADKKAIGQEIKEAFESFTEEHGNGEKSYNKALKKSYRNFKELQKDRAEFIIVETEADNMTEALLQETRQAEAVDQ